MTHSDQKVKWQLREELTENDSWRSEAGAAKAAAAWE